MAAEYVINWTDDQNGANPSKPRFTILPNEVNGPGRPNVNTPLQLPGRYVVNYGELILENFVHLLEHFAGPTEPSPTTAGMGWFDTSAGNDGILKIRDKTNTKWIAAGAGGAGGMGEVTDAPAVGGAGSSTADFTAEVGKMYFINTSTRVVTVTLPLSPQKGDIVSFVDLTGTFSTNALVINNNGMRLMGLLEPMTNNVNYSAFSLIYSDSTNGWRIL